MNSRSIQLTVVTILLALAGVSAGHAVAAERNPSPTAVNVNAVLTTGITFGGDKLREVSVDTVFSGTETEDIKAGESVFFAGGASVRNDRFEAQATIGYYVDGIFGENGETTFVRYPLELLGFWRSTNVRIGGGVTFHINPEFEFDVDDDTLPKETVRFDDAWGGIIQVEYLFSPLRADGGLQFGIGVRGTSIEYEAKKSPDKFDGDSIGLVFTFIL